MRNVLGLALVAMLSGCLSQARPRPVVEQPDPVVGQLGCSQPLSIIDALYRPVTPAPTTRDNAPVCPS